MKTFDHKDVNLHTFEQSLHQLYCRFVIVSTFESTFTGYRTVRLVRYIGWMKLRDTVETFFVGRLSLIAISMYQRFGASDISPIQRFGASDISPIQRFGVSIQCRPTHTLIRN